MTIQLLNPLRKWSYFFGISLLVQSILCVALMAT
jgi:hypothetical protein